jgi:hypothetical protein
MTVVFALNFSLSFSWNKREIFFFTPLSGGPHGNRQQVLQSLNFSSQPRQGGTEGRRGYPRVLTLHVTPLYGGPHGNRQQVLQSLNFSSQPRQGVQRDG